MANRHVYPFRPRVEVYEAQQRNPGATIRVHISASGVTRAVTPAEARELIALLEAAIVRAESGEPLPAVPRRPRPDPERPTHKEDGTCDSW